MIRTILLPAVGAAVLALGSCGSSARPNTVPADRAAPDSLGAALYTNCAACHGPIGQGGFGPPLAGNERLAETDYLIAHVLDGSPMMPAFRDQLTPPEIAAVLSHVRTWGKDLRPVTAAQVQAIQDRPKEPDAP